MSTARARLRELLSERYLPLLREAGFRGSARLAGNRLFHDYRQQARNGVHVLAIQFDKHQRPRFVINLHVEPEEGVEAVIARGGVIVTGRLKPRPGPHTRSWFRADPSWWRRVLDPGAPTREEEAVEQCIRLLPEVEAWWETQQPSRHITCLPVKYAVRLPPPPV